MLERPLEQEVEKKYKTPDGLAVDLCIFAITTSPRLSRREALPKRNLEVLLIKRSEQSEAYGGYWALPGGFTEQDETIEEAALRELKEETNIENPPFIKEVKAVNYPGRDPRGWIPTILYTSIVKGEDLADFKAEDDALDIKLVPIEEVFQMKLAFDHEVLIQEALLCVQRDMLQTTLAKHFLPKAFTIDQLLQVLQVVVPNYKLEKPNFIKKFVPLKNERSVLEEVIDQKLQDLFSHQDKLYRFKEKELKFSIYDSTFY